MILGMGLRERPADRGRRLGRERLAEALRDFRNARPREVAHPGDDRPSPWSFGRVGQLDRVRREHHAGDPGPRRHARVRRLEAFAARLPRRRRPSGSRSTRAAGCISSACWAPLGVGHRSADSDTGRSSSLGCRFDGFRLPDRRGCGDAHPRRAGGRSSGHAQTSRQRAGSGHHSCGSNAHEPRCVAAVERSHRGQLPDPISCGAGGPPGRTGSRRKRHRHARHAPVAPERPARGSTIQPHWYVRAIPSPLILVGRIVPAASIRCGHAAARPDRLASRGPSRHVWKREWLRHTSPTGMPLPQKGDLDRRPRIETARTSRPGRSCLLQVVLELPRPRRVPQLAQRLRLDLADPLAGHVELLADLLERAGTPVLEAEPELQDATLAAGE